VSHIMVNFSLPKLLDSSLYVSCWLVEDVAMPSRIYAVKCSVNEDQRHTIGITPINLFHVSSLDGPIPGHTREKLCDFIEDYFLGLMDQAQLTTAREEIMTHEAVEIWI